MHKVLLYDLKPPWIDHRFPQALLYSAPVSDSAPLRVLDLYILVRDGSKATFMRSHPFRLCLRAPPSRWAFDVDMGQPPELAQASPKVFSHAKGTFHEYNDAESEAIWCYSSSYEVKQK